MFKEAYHYLKYLFCGHHWENDPFYLVEFGLSPDEIYFMVAKHRCKKCKALLVLINDVCGKDSFLDSYWTFNYKEEE